MRTASGQPLMKFRLKKILDVLEKDAKAANWSGCGSQIK
jgi:hypothetical protein